MTTNDTTEPTNDHFWPLAFTLAAYSYTISLVFSLSPTVFLIMPIAECRPGYVMSEGLLWTGYRTHPVHPADGRRVPELE